MIANVLEMEEALLLEQALKDYETARVAYGEESANAIEARQHLKMVEHAGTGALDPEVSLALDNGQ